jgi:predicted neutral ceramidase superfamily lipid hydrolase
VAIRVLRLALTFVLIALAASDFTILSGWAAPEKFQFNYFALSHRSGWGSAYVSEYSFAQVVVYLLAYAAGLMAFAMVVRSGFRVIGGTGVVLCVLGFLSFALEASHWLLNHHSSLIASIPVVMLPLCLVAVFQLSRESRDADTPAVSSSPTEMA